MEFTVNGVQYLAVEVLKPYSDFRISCHLGFIRHEYFVEGIIEKWEHVFNLPVGSWEIVGKVGELSLRDIYFKIFNYKGGYRDPEADSSEEETALVIDYQELCIKHNLNHNDLILKRL